MKKFNINNINNTKKFFKRNRNNVIGNIITVLALYHNVIPTYKDDK